VIRPALRLVFLGACILPWGHAAQYLVVTRGADSAWKFEPVETVQINGKDKLRGAAIGSAGPWDSKAIGHLAESRLAEFTVVRRLPDGSVGGRAGEGEWRLLLPEGVKSKTADTAAHIWADASIEIKKDRKDKTPAAIRIQDLYAIVPGLDPAIGITALATGLGLHKAPGVSDADAFRAMLSLIPPGVKAMPAGTGPESVRKFLERGMSDRLRRWREGDCEIAALDEAAALGEASTAAFPGNAPLDALRAQVATSRQWVDRRAAILRALDAGKQSDAFLAAYREFEIYDKSFPALIDARTRHLKASALAHMDTARELKNRGDYAGAIRHLQVARWRDPQMAGAKEFLEAVRLEAARISAAKFAEMRGSVDTRSPAQVQLQRKLLLAEQFLQDNKQDEAEKAIKEAETADPDEPRLALLSARLAIARGELAKALALLDNYAGLAVTPQDFADGEKLRASVLYNLEKERTRMGGQLTGAVDDQRYASALEAAAGGLKVDNEAADFLFYAGANACILRNCEAATPLLHRFLDLTDATTGDRKRRLTAIRLLREADAIAAAAAQNKPAPAGNPSWFSGAPLARGVFYDPVSLSFQPKVARIEASEHVNVNYEWKGNQLLSVHTKFEEKKTGSNILKLAVAGAAASQGIGSTVGWRTADKETNDFYFSYYDDMPQILKVSRDNVVVKSQKIPISIPGMGGFGGFGMLGGVTGGLSMLNGLRGLSSMKSMMGGMSAMRGMPMMAGGMPGMMPGGMPGMPGMPGGALGTISRLSGMAGMGGMMGMASAMQFLPGSNYSVRNDPQGGSSAGYLTLWNSPRVDTRIAEKATGKRAAVGFSGNRYFHPFAWDAIHLFELDYDEQGRVVHAWELGEPKAPRLDFTWDGQRLLKVTGRDSAAPANVVYTRTLSYNGDRLVSENISYSGGKSSKIEYKYDKQGRLASAECDADHSLDGRSRKVHFVPEE
jgi:hypothetical protein